MTSGHVRSRWRFISFSFLCYAIASTRYTRDIVTAQTEAEHLTNLFGGDLEFDEKDMLVALDKWAVPMPTVGAYCRTSGGAGTRAHVYIGLPGCL